MKANPLAGSLVLRSVAKHHDRRASCAASAVYFVSDGVVSIHGNPSGLRTKLPPGFSRSRNKLSCDASSLMG